MRRLILLRHAEAEAEAVDGDFHRGLTERGLRDARRTGEALAERGLAPDLALVSTARRAVETWAQVAPAFPKAQMSLDAGLYNAAAPELMAAIQAAQAETIMVVAHNPGLQVLCMEFLARAGAQGEAGLRLFNPATAAAFAFDSGALRFEAVIHPEGG